ncbi:response regulator transcription factor [Sphingomonas sp. 28-63-12]|uniref:response regulator n=1 Tax=Sphingomonas sp. 28-63-12 TaxID=1970434 RepID=UPI000BD170FA|nr:MAG: DNA-binding response regulator [Sphingomonas sp. 28-63-12]
MRVLIVEDEAELAARMAASLSRHGMTPEVVGNAEDAASFAFDGFGVLVIDLGLPGMNGLDLIRQLRARGLKTPVLILTARGSWQDKVEGLNAGADDFIVKPVRIEELVARLHALARRAAGHSASRLQVGALSLDPGLKQAFLSDQAIDLTGTEFRLLSLLIYNAGRVLGQSAILDHLYPLQAERDPNTVEVHVGRLRRKVGRDRIRTVRGMGYRLVAA